MRRRDFLKTTGAAIGASIATSASRLAAASTRIHANPTSRHGDRAVGFALAGIGTLSTYQLIPALAKTRFARLAGVVTGTPSKGRKMIEEFGLSPDAIYDYDSMGRMADNPDIDVVYVVTPNVLHRAHTVAAARAGKHVLCEKPMAGSSADCEEMISACADAGVRLAVAYRCQFEPHHLECMRMARDRDFGSLKLVEAGLGFRLGDPSQWRLRRALAGGGAMMDVGVYALQACRYLIGEEPVSVSAFESKTDPIKFAEVDETMTFQLTFPSGAAGSCTTSYNMGGLNHFRGYCEQGWFSMNPAYSYRGLQGESSRGPLQFEATDQFAVLMDDFAQCVLEDRESKVPGVEGLRDLRIIEAIYESAATGRVVRLD